MNNKQDNETISNRISHIKDEIGHLNHQDRKKLIENIIVELHKKQIVTTEDEYIILEGFIENKNSVEDVLKIINKLN